MFRVSAWLAGAIVASHAGGAFGEECSSYKYYVMGYGSLMKEASRMKTSCGITSLTASNIEGILEMVGDGNLDEDVRACVKLTASQKMMPVRVKGARRGWYSAGNLAVGHPPEGWEAQALDLAPTYLGAVADDDSIMYAVVYPVTEKQLKATDEREASATYTPGWISAKDATTLNPDDSLPECSKIRWYPQDPKQVTVPTSQKPICQSYVDLFLSGVMDLGEKNNLPDYTGNVLNTTFGWSKSWVNDRAIAVRPFAQEKDAFTITKALGQCAKGALPTPTSTVPLPPGALDPLSFDIMEHITYPGQLPVTPDTVATPVTDDQDDTQEEDEFQRLFLMPSVLKTSSGSYGKIILAGIGAVGLVVAAVVHLRVRRSVNVAHALIPEE